MKERESFDDLLFENRNLEYGAYILRKEYKPRLIKAMVIGVVIISLIVIIPYLRVLGKTNEAGSARGERYVSATMDKLDQPQEETIDVPPPPPPPEDAAPVLRYVAPVVVDSVLADEKAPPTVADIQAAPPVNDNQEIVVSESSSENELMGDPDGTGDDEPFMIVEVYPTFRGGDINKFREWVQKRVVYPQLAMDNGIQGRVYLTFIVERDGTVTNVKTERGVDPVLDQAAEEAIAASPKWSPGLQRGRPVRVRFRMFINFTL